MLLSFLLVISDSMPTLTTDFQNAGVFPPGDLNQLFYLFIYFSLMCTTFAQKYVCSPQRSDCGGQKKASDPPMAGS